MRICLGLLLAITLAGCGGRGPLPPTAEESLIVFVVPSMTSQSGQYQPTYGDAPTLSLHDVTRAERKIVGVLSVGHKVAYRVPAGKHEFMLANRYSTDFLEANVAGGKTYYVLLQLLTDGGYSQRYRFRPVRPADFDNGSFGRWESNTSFIRRPAKWRAWSENNQETVDKRQREFRPAWDQLGPEDRGPKTLRVTDGR
jgi:predicted small lipoprotein YifL